MKKLIAIFAVVLFAAPAFAADWSFYGSQRIAHLVRRPGLRRRRRATARTTTRPPNGTSRATPAWAPRSKPTRSAARSSSVSGPAATAGTPMWSPGAPTACGISRTMRG